MTVGILADGSGWGVYDSDGNLLQKFVGDRGEEEAFKWIKDNDHEDTDGDDGENTEPERTHGFDWEGKFNLDLKDLFSKYGVDSDMQKYFEGMEYDPQEETFLQGLFDIEKKKTHLQKQGIGRQRGSLMGSLDMNLDNVMRSGESESFQLNQASTQRSQQVGGMRGGTFADRFQSQTTQSGVYGQQNQMMGQAEAKLGALDDAMTSLDFEAQQASIGFEQDIYGQRQQWMDDFFDRLMQVEQMEES